MPSSLLLGATTYITTDIAAIPLLWVLPLAIYLLSFIIAFGRWPASLQRMLVAVAVPGVLVLLFLVLSSVIERIWVTVLWHLGVLLVVALACHGEAALDRPPPRYLTEFYLLLSVGGVLGGLFNALIAPLIFNSLAEYPLAMVLGAMLLGARRWRSGRRPDAWRAAALAIGAGVLALVLYSDSVSARIDFSFLARVFHLPFAWTHEHLDPIERIANRMLTYGPPLLIAFLLRRRPWALGGALAAVLLVAGFVDARNSEQIRQSRSFFGVLRITRDRDDKGFTSLRHGTTLHGQQSLEPVRRGEPLTYYHRQGPIGQLFAELDQRPGSLRIAVIGLGTGTLAAYARPGDAVTFYEIDRLVRDVAFDRSYFTYVADALDRGATVRVELGDARIRLDAIRLERPGERYDVIAVDAFSSDAIPVHLLTREALRLYLEMLKPDGIVAVHISNRYLDLEPVVANLAEDAGLQGRLIEHDDSPETAGAARSTWVLLSPTAEALGKLPTYPRWMATRLSPVPKVGVWTDNFHNLLAVFRWGDRAGAPEEFPAPHSDQAPP